VNSMVTVSHRSPMFLRPQPSMRGCRRL
jgi:hypothetical protein